MLCCGSLAACACRKAWAVCCRRTKVVLPSCRYTRTVRQIELAWNPDCKTALRYITINGRKIDYSWGLYKTTVSMQ